MSGAPPAANTRGAFARQQPPLAVAVGGAAPADDAGQQEGKDGEQSPAAQQAAGAGGAAAAADPDRFALARMMQTMQAMQDKIARLEQAQPPPQPAQSLSLDASAGQPPHSSATAFAGSDVAALIRAMQDSAAAQADQMRQQQAAASAHLLILQSLGELPTFSGKGADTTLVAHEWLTRAEDFFAAREQAMNTTAALSDKARLLNAANALTEDARRWYQALPARPTTWAAFRAVIEARFCSVPSVRIRVDKLHEFIDKAARLRDKLNVQGMQAFTARFAQLAGEVPDSHLTAHGKLALLARGLPQSYAEVVLKEDAKEPPPALHEVINVVLSRAANKEQAAAYGGASSSSGPAAASVNAVELAALTFGWSREEAARHLEDGEGWAAHDTDAGPSQRAPTGPAAFAPASHFPDDQLERLVNAITARIGAGPAARDNAARNGASGGNSRRNVSAGVRNEIPAELVEARKAAGLCIKCGVVKYEGGGKGHNAGTCKAAADKTTTVAEGKKKAGF
jgi:hypothetical protein